MQVGWFGGWRVAHHVQVVALVLDGVRWLRPEKRGAARRGELRPGTVAAVKAVGVRQGYTGLQAGEGKVRVGSSLCAHSLQGGHGHARA